MDAITVYFHGKPVVGEESARGTAAYIWQHDSLGNRWVATANEGLGASAWWPDKDYLADEPDSQRIAVTVPDPMIDVSNGRLRSTTHHADGTTTYEWFVAEPDQQLRRRGERRQLRALRRDLSGRGRAR